MSDATTTVGDLRQLVAGFIEEREWEQFHHPKDVAISLSLEAAELLEHFQWEDRRPLDKIRKNGELIDQLSDEMADILHYLITMANVLDIDITRALENKMAKNAEKYPVEASRGKALKYTRFTRNNHQTLTDDEI